MRAEEKKVRTKEPAKAAKRTAAQVKAGVRAVVEAFVANARAASYSATRGELGQYSPLSLWDRIFHWEHMIARAEAERVDMELTILSSELAKRGLL